MKIQLKKTQGNSTGDIFHFISTVIDLEWFDNDFANDLDLEYYFGRSGDKKISVLFYKLLEKHGVDLDNPIATDNVLTDLANIIVRKFKDNWNKTHEVYFVESYDPLHNYNMTESENVNTKISTITNDNTYGFNTDNEDGVPKDKNVVTQEGSNNDNKRNMTRSGNIGVTTSQKMLTDELKLRTYNFINKIYEDVDSVLVSSIY